MSEPIKFIQDLSVQITVASWSIFLITWSIGWILRGSPIPFARVKRTGQSLIEDAVWAAFWLSIGSLLFSIITKVASILQDMLS